MEENQPQNKKRKYLFAAFVLLLVVLAVVVFFYYKGAARKNQPPLENIAAKEEASLTLKYGDRERWFSGEISEGMTVLGVLQTASIAGKFDLNASSTISSLDGFSDGNPGAWQCLFNGNLLSESLAEKKVQAKDEILCEYRRLK